MIILPVTWNRLIRDTRAGVPVDWCPVYSVSPVELRIVAPASGTVPTSEISGCSQILILVWALVGHLAVEPGG